jgi:hypothetical protein
VQDRSLKTCTHPLAISSPTMFTKLLIPDIHLILAIHLLFALIPLLLKQRRLLFSDLLLLIGVRLRLPRRRLLVYGLLTTLALL